MRRIGWVVALATAARIARGDATPPTGAAPAPGIELVHGYLLAVGDQTLGAAYRLPPSVLDQQPMWEHVLDAIRIEK